MERIVELAPDLVLLNEEENRVEDHDALVEAGVACWSSFPKDPADVPGVLRELGRRVGADAEPIAQEIERQLAALNRPVRRPTFIYLCWRQPWMAAASDTFASRLLEAAGGRCVVPGEERYPVLEPAAIQELDPDLVLLSSEPFPFEASHALELSEATGIPEERFRLCDGRELSWHGSRTVTGLPYAARILAVSAGL